MNSGSDDAEAGGKDDVQNLGDGSHDQEAKPSSADLRIFVEQALDQMEQDGGLLSEMIEDFVNRAPDLLNDIEKAAASRDGEALRQAAQGIRRAAANIGAEPMLATALTLEEMGQDGTLADVEHMVTQLLREVDELKAVIESIH